MTRARRVFKNAARKARLNYDKTRTEQLLTAKYSNAKLYWKLLKGTKPRVNTKVSPHELYDYFKNLSMANYDVDDVELDDMMNDEVVIMFDELNVPFTELEVSDAIKVTKKGKSGGEDLLINEFFYIWFRCIVISYN